MKQIFSGIYIFSSFQISIRIFVPGAEHLCNFATVRGLHRQSTIPHGTFDTRKKTCINVCAYCSIYRNAAFVLFVFALSSVPVDCTAPTNHGLTSCFLSNHFWGCQWRHIRFVTCRFLMVFLCLLLSIFSTIRELQEVSSLVLYYLVSKSVVHNVHVGMNFTPIVLGDDKAEAESNRADQ